MRSQPVDSWPALYKGTVNWDPSGAPFAQPLVPDMVVVGATNDSGQLCEWVRLSRPSQGMIFLTVETESDGGFRGTDSPGV